MDFKDRPRSERPHALEGRVLLNAAKQGTEFSTSSPATRLKCTHPTALSHFESATEKC